MMKIKKSSIKSHIKFVHIVAQRSLGSKTDDNNRFDT